MNVKSLLALAGECKTEAQVEPVFKVFKEAFTKRFEKRLSCLYVLNDQYHLEEEGEPFLQFEVSYVVSSWYVISAQIEIRSGDLVIYVVRNHMLDGLGMDSQNWEEDADDEKLLEFEDDSTVSTMIKSMVDEFIHQHTLLLEVAGLTPDEAKQAATRVWKRKATRYSPTEGAVK